MKRVVITGAGTINPIGHTVPATLEAMREGRCGIGPLEMRDVERLSIRIGGQVKDYDPDTHYNRQQQSLYDRFTQFTLIAAGQALDQAGLGVRGPARRRGGRGARHLGRRAHHAGRELPRRLRGGEEPRPPLHRPEADEQRRGEPRFDAVEPQGPSFTVATACASSNHAMGLAFQIVRSGASRVMVTGGSESMLCFGGIKAWEGLRVMSKDACRPFSATRNGMVQGEGAAVFVFEEMEHAKARGADILAEVVGFSMTSDASDIVMPSKQGAARAITGALRDGRINPEAVGYINAHGTGTAANDKTECAAVADAFGHHADRLMISSTKSMHGHLIGGTGAVELLACIMALRDGVIAPTIGYEEPDPECALDVVPNVAREAKVDVVLSNAFAFGGLNAVLALKKV